MVRRIVACGLLLTLSLASFGGDKPGAKLPPAPTNAGLEKMKKSLPEPLAWLTKTWCRPTCSRVDHQGDSRRCSIRHETSSSSWPAREKSVLDLHGRDGPGYWL